MIGYQAYRGRSDQSGTETDEYLCGKQMELTLIGSKKTDHLLITVSEISIIRSSSSVIAAG